MAATVIVGDTSSHGNKVLQGATSVFIGGIPVAYVSSAVSGDSHDHGPNAIGSSGNGNNVFIGGNPVACSGAMTQCGASISGSGSNVQFG
jgi:uncharacterized Zn-binding protein involved in type VI secretion